MSDENERKIIFTMKASTSGMFFVNGCVYIIGAGVLALLLLIRGLYALPIFISLALVFGAYMIVDNLVWKANGIRRVEVDEEGITFYRGKDNRPQRIENTQITGIDVFGKFNRRVINIFTGGGAIKPVPGITLFSGSRVRITNDLFDNDKFKQFMLIILQFEHGYKQ